MKTFKESSLINIRIGDWIRYEDGRIGQLRSIELTPNGATDLQLVTVLTVKLETGNLLSATSSRFTVIADEPYLERMY